MKSSDLQGHRPLSKEAEANLAKWLEGDYPEEIKSEISKLLKEDPEEAENAFAERLSFGTGGMRGPMGLGSARMNLFTVGAAAQGISNYLIEQKGEGLSAVIGYDTRHQSKEFAQEIAKVFAASGIKAILFSAPCSTPLVSYACRYYKSAGAVMVTASHNPPIYNGLKVYWDDGGQVLPPHDTAIVEKVNQIDSPSEVKKALDSSPLISMCGNEVEKAYLNEIASLSLLSSQNKEKGKELKIVYTPLHGVGGAILPNILKDWGFTRLILVDKQMIPDGSFPTAPSPNPEDKNALAMGLGRFLEEEADLLLATDPDADRIAAVVMHQGEVKYLTGNQTASLLAFHLLSKENPLPENPCLVKSCVTTDLVARIGEAFGAKCYDVLPGFKYIGQLMTQWEKSGETFILGAEESLGYLAGTHVRDKDGLVIGALLAEIALDAKLKGKTLFDLLLDLYKRFGVYREGVQSIKYEPSTSEKRRVAASLENLRKKPPSELIGEPIEIFEDYTEGVLHHLQTGEKSPINLPKAKMVRLIAKGGASLHIRPSGTEPKVKLYASCQLEPSKNVEKDIDKADQILTRILEEGKKFLELD